MSFLLSGGIGTASRDGIATGRHRVQEVTSANVPFLCHQNGVWRDIDLCNPLAIDTVADTLSLAPPLADHGDVVSALPFFLPPLLGVVILIAVVLHDRLGRRRREPRRDARVPPPGSAS